MFLGQGLLGRKKIIAAAPAGPTTVFELALTSNEAGYSLYTVRDLIDATSLSAASGNTARVSLGLFALGDTTTVVAYIGQQAAAGNAYDVTAFTQLTGADFGAGTYTQVGSGTDLTIVSGFVTLNEAYDEAKSYVISAYFGVASATIYRTAGNHTYYKSGNTAALPTEGSYTDNGAFTTLVRKIEIQ